ncbi:RraA family protein [Roseomonas marmotae]|uniref:RraA family protein n=2 Tax=Roseomonas marmotae TaxID=2768161 RepID=A0ABS3KIJ2_9PROT|nr:RraA family protein [Roseomonas marmotae]MBO1077294.1 RraA family protein [Roseomonas marmotae]QTI80803.1 RraA family protein [Roseomonas marmotae]
MQDRLFTALLSDVLDSLGHMHQALPARIRPLDEACRMAGRARTALYLDVYEAREGENPYDLEIDLVDSLQPGEIPVFACGHSGRIAPWGELLSTAAQVRGSSGALMDGMVRDVTAIRAMGYPVFHGGIGPLDSKGRGKIVAVDVPVECGGVRVCPGDFVFGDADGAIVVPRALEAEVARRAEVKLKGEKETLRELRAGVPLRVVFEKYGIL